MSLHLVTMEGARPFILSTSIIQPVVQRAQQSL